MRTRSEKIRGISFHIWAYLRRDKPAIEVTGDEPPLRAELFSKDQMKRHAIKLAGSHKLSLKRPSVRFLANRDENLRFALATDFRNASEETTPEENRRLEQKVC